MTALIDTNVFVAAVVADHPHRDPARAVLERARRHAVSAHSLLELYNTLSKPRGYAWNPRRAGAVVRQIGSEFEVLQLSTAGYFDAVAGFARAGGIGARIYDHAIGQVAIENGIGIVVTLNSSDFIALFPDLTILTPLEYLES